MAAIVLLWPLALHAQRAHDYKRAYTQEHPLVYIDTWDLPPYVFLNEQGQPDGYTIDLLKLMLNELNIPYVIKLKPTLESQTDFRNGMSDLIISSQKLFEGMEMSKNVVLQYAFSVAYPKTMNIDIKNIEDLKGHQFYVRKGSRYFQHVQNAGLENQSIRINDMSEALKKVSTDLQGLVLWNTLSIKWVLHKYQIDNILVDNIDIPPVTYRIVSPDSVLTARLDSVYTLLNATERLQPLQAKWFYPERLKENQELPAWVWYLVAIAAIAAILLIVYNRIFHKREREVNAETHTRNRRLELILYVSKVRLCTFDIATQTFTWLARDLSPERKYTVDDFRQRYDQEDFNRLMTELHLLATEQKEEASLELRVQSSVESDEPMDTLTNIWVLRRDKNGKPVTLIGARIDITEEKNKQRTSKDMLHRYRSIFTTSMVDMMSYDADGYVNNMNERAQATFHVKLEDALEERVNMRQMITKEELDVDNFEYFYATRFFDTTKSNPVKSSMMRQLMFYELQLIALRDKQGKMLGAYGTGRDVTEVVQSYHNTQDSIKKLQEANKNVANYVRNINYAMKVGGIRIANYAPDTHTLTLFGQADQAQLVLTQTRCIYFIDEEDKMQAIRMLNTMDDCADRSIDVDLRTTLRTRHGHQLHLQFQFIPVQDNEGRVASYFGMCRDVSDLKATEKELELETARAQEVEDLKNNFLRNMSYEIRTPLNTVMGFAELLEMNHSPEEETLFIQEIKENSSHLLHLINGILFLSRLDAHMIEINPQPTDFAISFESHCQMGWANYMQEGVHYTIDNPYEHLIVNIDDSNVGHIIEQVAANAAQHTKEGRVSARYVYVPGKLIITIDDTGEGMDKHTLDSVYQRFASGHQQGSGLGMPICQELARQMNGVIDITSQEGKGTTVWITIPCEVSSMERKMA